MADYKPSELQAENLISHHLLKHKFKLSKPTFDIQGADLLILDSIDNMATKFLKIQSKLRTIGDKKGSEVSIPLEYVTDNFVLFLYLNREDEAEVLYTFFKDDIVNWRIKNNEYKLGLSENSVLELRENIFSKKTVDTLKKLLKIQEVKKYTSIIIDGIFLEKAIASTKNLYAEIWPDKTFKKLRLENVVKNLLIYNQFAVVPENINCIVLLSENHGLECVVDMPKNKGYNQYNKKVRFTIYKSGDIISFQVLEQLERVINAENVLLVADDVIYQNKLDELAERGVDIIMIKEHEDSGSRLFTSFRWGDIAYPLGRSLGLKRYEL